MKKNSAYITGLGAISAPGTGVETGFTAICEGRDSIKPLTLFDARLKVVPLCAQVNDISDNSDNSFRTLSLALSAVTEAIAVLPQKHNFRIGVIVSTTVGGISYTERIYEKLKNDPSFIAEAAGEFNIHEPTVLSSRICKHIGGSGFHTLSTACSTGLHVIGMAKRLVEQDQYDACLAVGADALSMLTIRGFGSLTLLDPQGCRPFDKRRAGISLGEGAGAMLIASEKVAAQCSNGKVAIVSGWGASADCYHMTAPHPQGLGAISAVKDALTEAQIDPQGIGFIAAHGTGTPDNDRAEIKAMESIFDPLPPFCSMKRTLGHTLAASGILEAVFAVKALVNGIVPPTPGFEILDEEIGRIPQGKFDSSMKHVLKTSFGFGGNNAAVIFSRLDS